MSPSVDKIKESGMFSSEDKKKYTVNDIIKDARNNTKNSLSQLQIFMMPEKKNLRKLQLEPIKREDLLINLVSIISNYFSFPSLSY